VSTLSQVLNLKFNRVQFTPDLMPSDITGSEVLERPGFGYEVLQIHTRPHFLQHPARDEINRASPKTQAASFQAMQEKKVTVGGETYPIAARSSYSPLRTP
jgi:MoxR-like ATPase